MLSEYTLKAIDIVCEGCDTEFKEQVTKHLEIFYKQMHETPIDKDYGLCINLSMMLINNFELDCSCNDVLSKSFEIAGLDRTCPFNDGSLEKYFAEKYPYENPKRLAWVADNVNGSQQR